ncbi:MAG: hypothetical protein NTW40_08540 [Acidobacteria bacterium]|nr:hypothetical protein [Acidobacteriota bacterium]
MGGGQAVALGPVGGRAQHQVEGGLPGEEVWIPQVPQAGEDAVFLAVVGDAAAGQAEALLLGFHGVDLGPGTAPGCQEGDAADAGAQVRDAPRPGAPAGAVPGRDQVICTEAVALGQLKDAPAAAEAVQGLPGFRVQTPRRRGAGAGPALEGRGIIGGRGRGHPKIVWQLERK